MGGTTDRYINLFTDFGFKKLFGEEPNKGLLISLLNSLFQGKEQVADITYLKNERLGKNEGERRAVYDLYCSNEKGEKFIVEIQRVKQEFFKDRSLYYATFAIQEQALKGQEWNYKLKAVYMIAILDFTFSNTSQKLHHRVRLIEEESNQIFYEKLSFIYLEVPKFEKSLSELQNDYERWLYAFKNLHRLREKPHELEEGIFHKLFELAEIAKMKDKERNVYENSLKDYRDLKSAIETYFKEGKEEGRKLGLEEGRKEGMEEGMREGMREGRMQGLEEGKAQGMKEGLLQIAKTMLANGEAIEKIAKFTGLNEEEIRALQ